MSHRVTIGSEDVTGHIDGDLTYSNVDPGGYELATFTFPRRVTVRKGENVRIESDLAPQWLGRVSEPGQSTSRAGSRTDIACRGRRRELEDESFQEIYRDADLGRWADITLGYKIVLAQSGLLLYGADRRGRPRRRRPGARDSHAGSVDAASRAGGVAWYDAGGVRIGKVFYRAQPGPVTGVAIGAYNFAGDVNWQTYVLLCRDDQVTSPYDSTGNISQNASHSGTLTAADGDRRFVFIEHFYATAGGGDTLIIPSTFGRSCSGATKSRS